MSRLAIVECQPQPRSIVARSPLGSHGRSCRRWVLAVRKRNPIWSSCRAEDRFLCFFALRAMMSHTTKPEFRSLQPRWLLIFSTTGLIRSRPRCALGRVIHRKLIRGELDTVLARARYGRSQMVRNEESADVTGHRHGSRPRSLTGTFGPIEIAVPRARLNTPTAGRRSGRARRCGLTSGARLPPTR